MKAAVIYQRGDMPQYTEVQEPIVQNDGQVLISVTAAAIKHFDKGKASGKHYSAGKEKQNVMVIGGDGVGLLADGTRVFALAKAMIAEKAVVEKNRIIKLPPGIDDGIAAALPNAVAGSAMALHFRAAMKPDETILINGATGFTGKIAVQMAKHYGAKRIIATGRNEQSLHALLALGADEIIPIKGDDQFIARIKKIQSDTPPDVIIDYLWGQAAELILAALKGDGSFTHKVRFVSVGAMAGDHIRLSAENLRSVDLQLSGSGLGSWSKDEMNQLFSEIIPEMFQLAVDKKLLVDIEKVSLSNIETLWNMEAPGGKRLVITMP